MSGHGKHALPKYQAGPRGGSLWASESRNERGLLRIAADFGSPLGVHVVMSVSHRRTAPDQQVSHSSVDRINRRLDGMRSASALKLTSSLLKKQWQRLLLYSTCLGELRCASKWQKVFSTYLNATPVFASTAAKTCCGHTRFLNLRDLTASRHQMVGSHVVTDAVGRCEVATSTPLRNARRLLNSSLRRVLRDSVRQQSESAQVAKEAAFFLD